MGLSPLREVAVLTHTLSPLGHSSQPAAYAWLQYCRIVGAGRGIARLDLHHGVYEGIVSGVNDLRLS
jgi:hypothetical protein